MLNLLLYYRVENQIQDKSYYPKKMLFLKHGIGFNNSGIIRHEFEFLFYMREDGTIPRLQQWFALGMSMGSAAAFMITGPATKITSLGAVTVFDWL
jgi:hypothetical protein